MVPMATPICMRKRVVGGMVCVCVLREHVAVRCASFINANAVWAKFVLFSTSEGSGPIYSKTLISLLGTAAFLQLNRMSLCM